MVLNSTKQTNKQTQARLEKMIIEKSKDGEFTTGAMNAAGDANPSRVPGITVKKLSSTI